MASPMNFSMKTWLEKMKSLDSGPRHLGHTWVGSVLIRQEITSQPTSFTDTLPLGLDSCAVLPYLESFPYGPNQLDSMDPSIVHVARWKQSFKALSISKNLGLGFILDWAQEAGSSQDYLFIANCFS